MALAKTGVFMSHFYFLQHFHNCRFLQSYGAFEKKSRHLINRPPRLIQAALKHEANRVIYCWPHCVSRPRSFDQRLTTPWNYKAISLPSIETDEHLNACADNVKHYLIRLLTLAKWSAQWFQYINLWGDHCDIDINVIVLTKSKMTYLIYCLIKFKLCTPKRARE
jgi:hypothetical protein